MIHDEDDLLHDLANLRAATPDPHWEQHVRLRCHAKMASGRIAKPFYSKLKLADVIALAVLCVYLSGVLRQAARVFGL